MKALTPGSVIICLALFAGSASAQTSVVIGGITNVSHDSVLAGSSTHALTIRFNSSGVPAGRSYLTSNGFRIFSPDGADWVSVQGSGLQPFTSLEWNSVFVNHFHVTGGSGQFGMPMPSAGGNETGNDTAVVLLAGIRQQPGGGLQTGFDNLALEIEFQSRREDAGLHICIDTSQGAPGAAWEWGNPDGLVEPAWSGRRCFVIGCCGGMVGDVDGYGGDEPTLGDVMALVGYLFVDGVQPSCLEEADVNQSGSTFESPLGWEDISLADIMYLVGYLYTDGPLPPLCP